MEVLDAVGPLNAFLCDLHGPTDHIARTMSRLVPFPEDVGSFPDADLLDLNVSVRADIFGSDCADVEAWARYATGARVSQIRDFYLTELTRAGATIDVPAHLDRTTSHIVSAALADQALPSFRVTVEEFSGYRSVKVTVSYSTFEYRSLFARFAHWHNGNAPVRSGLPPTGVEISTFANGRRANQQHVEA